MSLEWSARALSDLNAIHVFIARDSTVVASRFIAALVHATDILLSSPNSGRKVPELADESIRELIFRNYRIVYKVDHESISILSVFEGHKLL